jgi:DNA-binding GntR family transcriptional regulator
MTKQTASKKQVAYDRIKALIMNNELKAGEPIVERTLCETLGISRTPVRAAFTELSKEGLVDVVPGRGVFVARIRFEDMIEVYDIREALECMSVKLLTERITKEELSDLEEIVERMQHLSGSEFMALDMQLHTTMARYSKNKRLAQTVNLIYSPIRLIAATAQNDTVLCENALRDHQEILQAVSSRDVERSVECMRRHIQNVREYHIKNYFLFSPSP